MLTQGIFGWYWESWRWAGEPWGHTGGAGRGRVGLEGAIRRWRRVVGLEHVYERLSLQFRNLDSEGG